VGTSAVECSEPEHELLEFERLGEVVVGAEPEPGDLVVEPVGSGEHEDGHATAGGDDAFRDLVTGGPGDVAVEDGDVIGVAAQLPGVGRRGWLLPDRVRPRRPTHA
jgi:hypothetical protein